MPAAVPMHPICSVLTAAAGSRLIGKHHSHDQPHQQQQSGQHSTTTGLIAAAQPTLQAVLQAALHTPRLLIITNSTY
jgi:hypothetical protein